MLAFESRSFLALARQRTINASDLVDADRGKAMEGALLVALTRAFCRAEAPSDIRVQLLDAGVPDLQRQFDVILFTRGTAPAPVEPRT